MHAAGKDMAADYEENHVSIAWIAVIGLVAGTGNMPRWLACDDQVRGRCGFEVDELAFNQPGCAGNCVVRCRGIGHSPRREATYWLCER